MKAIIFSGGIGTRLWPLSRAKTPKQFMNYVSDKTMFQLSFSRLLPEFDINNIFVVTGKQFQRELHRQVPLLKKENMILEPSMRDVGPAVGLVAAIFSKRFPNEPIAILWGSDHLVKNESLFKKMLFAGEKYVTKKPNTIVFYGQKPRFPSVNLGWISIGEKIDKINNISIYSFGGWHYRPNYEDACKLLENGKSAWNTGYFVTTPVYLWGLFKKHAHNLYKKLNIIHEAFGTTSFQKVLEKTYPLLEKIHFDNAVLEKMDCQEAVVLVEDIGWSDVGAWEQLKEALQASPEANVTKGTVVLENTSDSLVYNYDEHKLIVGIDLNNFLIVNTPDVLLVTKKSSVRKLTQVVKNLSKTKHKKFT